MRRVEASLIHCSQKPGSLKLLASCSPNRMYVIREAERQKKKSTPRCPCAAKFRVARLNHDSVSLLSPKQCSKKTARKAKNRA